jgi:hypothetical protein
VSSSELIDDMRRDEWSRIRQVGWSKSDVKTLTSNTPVSSPTSLVTTDAVRIMRRNATSQQALQDGVVEATTANAKTLPTTNGVLVLGARPAALGTPRLTSSYRVYEIIVVRSDITDAEIASLQTYAANKWGV